MEKEVITFGGVKIKERIFHYHKNLILIDVQNIDKKLISKNVSTNKNKF